MIIKSLITLLLMFCITKFTSDVREYGFVVKFSNFWPEREELRRTITTYFHFTYSVKVMAIFDCYSVAMIYRYIDITNIHVHDITMSRKEFLLIDYLVIIEIHRMHEI